MESLLEDIIRPLPWILLAVFGLFSIFVKEVRVTSSVIFLGSLIVLAFQGVFAEGTTISYLYKGVIDMTTALILIMLYGQIEAKKAPQQALVFILFSFSHGWLMYEVFNKTYWFYDKYDSVMIGLTMAHFLVMWDYYEELYKNIKEVWSTRRLVYRRALRLLGLVRGGKPRESNVGNSNGCGGMGLFRSGTYDKNRKNEKECESYHES